MRRTSKRAGPGFSFRMHLTRSKRRNEGQSLAEFILTFGFIALIVVFFIQLSLNLTKGFLVHYATFMTSRSYLVNDNNSQSPSSVDGAAKTYSRGNVFKKIIPKFKQNDIGFNHPGLVENKVFVGVVAKFTEKYSLSSMVGGNKEIELISESFLGRVPSIAECAQGVCNGAMLSSGVAECGSGDDTTGHMTMWDNGC